MTAKEVKEYLGDKLPKKLNKYGEWLLSDNKEYVLEIRDLKAALR